MDDKMVKKLASAMPLVILYAVRMMQFITTPIDGLRAYGDLPHFFELSNLSGWPFINFWSEFPPLFPFLSKAIYLLARGQEASYDYLLLLVLFLADIGNLILFMRLGRRLWGEESGLQRSWIYTGLLVGLVYFWWYFDTLGVFFLLLAITFYFEGRDLPAGIVTGLGILTKLFPGLVLVMIWRTRPWRQALLATVVSLGMVIAVYGSLYTASPAMTRASLLAQSSKGSWETAWALIDGNYQTGNFGPVEERTDPQTAYLPRGNPARIPSMVVLPVFAVCGIWVFFKGKNREEQASLALLGVALVLLFLWFPGWSPQWALYLVPVILLTLPLGPAIVWTLAFVGVNLLEYPFFMGRRMGWSLWLLVPMRIAFMGILSGYWLEQLGLRKAREKPVKTAEAQP